MPPKNNLGSDKQQKVNNVKSTSSERTKKSGKEASAESVAGPSSSPPTSRKIPPTKSNSGSAFKAPDNPIRIVDFRTETSPTRLHTEASGERPTKPSPSAKKQTQRHKSSSTPTVVESMDGGNKQSSSAPPSRLKPPSAISKVSHTTNRSQTPLSETNNENASTAGSIGDSNSISAHRIKRTESERKQYLENEPESGSIEAHRVFCNRCKEWVKLSTRQTYYVKAWEVHRAKCDQKLPVGDTYKDLGLVATIPFVVPRTEKARKVLLELDDTAEAVESSQIKCKACQQWVPLEKKYNIKCWTRHAGACNNNLKPGDIEKMLERKLFFMCDKQCKNIRSKHSVECAACNEEVILKPKDEYDLDLWLAHKETCQFSNADAQSTAIPLPKPESATTTAPPPEELEPSSTQPQTQPENETMTSTSRQPEESTALRTDSERTLVPLASSISSLRLPPPSPVLASISTLPAAVTSATASSSKRKREPDNGGRDSPTDDQSLHDVDMDEERPARRARTTGYVPEDKDAPDGLGWFLLPFKAFVEGFKQSLSTLDS